MSEIEIHTLVCKKHVRLASAYLPTLLRHSQKQVRLILHDDGSISRPEAQFLIEKLPGAQFMRRDHADAQMERRLHDFPALRQFRRENVFGLKLLDIALLADEAAPIVYCDADVWFFRPFRDIFALPPGAGALFMWDYDHSVCVRSWQLLGGKIALAKHINAGFFTVAREAFDLPLLERFVADVPSARPYFTEQTGWALLAQHADAHLWSRTQVALMNRRTQFSPELVVAHVVKPFRWRFPEIRAQNEAFDYSALDLPRFETTPVQKLSAGELLKQEFARIGGKIHRKWGR